jgi:hypothetical protein
MVNEFVIRFSDVLKTVNQNQSLKKGCLIDNSILFSASHPPDRFNQESEELFDYFSELKIPLFSNVNIRSEFMNKQRQVMIPEGLSDLYTSTQDEFLIDVRAKLKSAYTTISEARRFGTSYKYDENQIKSWRKFLRKHSIGSQDAWFRFCEDYLQGKIENIWNNTCDEFGINFLSLRQNDNSELIHASELNWEGMATLVGKYGLASSDAMIVNLFLNSNLCGLVTADEELPYVINHIRPKDKFVIVPDSLALELI